jgi:hypothetical protein
MVNYFSGRAGPGADPVAVDTDVNSQWQGRAVAQGFAAHLCRSNPSCGGYVDFRLPQEFKRGGRLCRTLSEIGQVLGDRVMPAPMGAGN